MKISVGCDHGALTLKNKVVEHLKKNGHEVMDFGTHTAASCDYPEFAAAAAIVQRAGTGRALVIAYLICHNLSTQKENIFIARQNCRLKLHHQKKRALPAPAQAWADTSRNNKMVRKLHQLQPHHPTGNPRVLKAE